MALSALGGPASAAEPDAPHNSTATASADRPGSWDALSSRVQKIGDRPLKDLGPRPGETPAGSWESGDRPDRVLRTWQDDVGDLGGNVREIEDDPVRYLQKRRHEVFDRKDRAVHELQELTDAAGVPRVRLSDVRRAPIVRDLADGVVKQNPVPDVEWAEHGHANAAPGHVATERPGSGTTFVPDAPADEAATGRDAGDCAGCRGGERRGPLLPADQDEPWNGSSGGHQLAPVAELRSVRSPAVPPGVEPGGFHRTALTDVSAPGGPSVVPD
ncbi:hypothetical protein E1264_28745 [Actinomadura sp. KC216]|uniref:hypothetical protein n=1 Tax=Actinomadura sp. KC216 TaxID=2530370 RepID=UPI00104936A3|nr:hypothetical protein [Actinomadura sp. KC216]TDB83349.1 hypothetical protein E1264_28745 [Actinomadura sp. KC216]